jgi:hypothetical protein
MVSRAEARRIDRCLRLIPSGAGVSATDAVLPHLTHRRLAYPLFVGQPTPFRVVGVEALPSRSRVVVCQTDTIAVVSDSLR